MNFKLKKFILVSIIFVFSACNSNQNTSNLIKEKTIHKAHLNDGWYRQNKFLLDEQLDIFFKNCSKNLNMVIDSNSVKALIVPHAGYIYSGLCAASCYQNLFENKDKLEKNNKIKKVIILSPSHFRSFDGICLPDYGAYQTVFGQINVDLKSINILKESSIFKILPQVHENEHAIEVQLPFLQKTIKSFEIVPLIVGSIDKDKYDKIASILEKIIDETTLVVISSDFMHYGSNYGYAPFGKDVLDCIKFLDSVSVESITKKSFDYFDQVLKETSTTICGQNAIKILLKLLQKNVFVGLDARLSCYYTSKQIENTDILNKNTGTSWLFSNFDDAQIQNSVSYVGLVFSNQLLDSLKKKDQLSDYEKKALLNLARRSIENSFKLLKQKTSEDLLWPIKSFGISKTAGAFVTLNNKSGDLRGCIGRIVADEPLFKTVQRMSKAAAFEDSRFEPLKKEELDNIVIDISILTPPEPVKSYKEIQLGKHGIILEKNLKEKGWKSAVFLPQVPVSLGWDLKTTLEQLSLKAGMGKNDWQNDCEFEVFEGFEIKE